MAHSIGANMSIAFLFNDRPAELLSAQAAVQLGQARMTSNRLFGKAGSSLTAGPCTVCAASPISLHASCEHSEAILVHEILFSADKETPSPTKPGVAFLVVELGVLGSAAKFVQLLVERLRPTHTFPTIVAIAFLPNTPAPIFLPMLWKNGASEMRMIGTSSPYIFTYSTNGFEDTPHLIMTTTMAISPQPRHSSSLSMQRDVLTPADQKSEPADTEPELEHESTDEVFETAMDWDFIEWHFREFIEFYGNNIGEKQWLTALFASNEAEKAMQYLIYGKHYTLEALWFMLANWLPKEITVEEGYHTLLAAFYVPLRWRCDYLQEIGVPFEDWGRHDLSSKKDQVATWSRVKAHAWWSLLNGGQRAGGNRSKNILNLILNLMINRTSKCSTLCKLLISHGVPDEEMFDTIAALTAFYKNRPLSQRREIAVAHNVTPHVAKSNYR
ncbi:MAG: hypothetical protein NZ777_11395, partial [Pseudomonadales bacterium]|nr:hypothetical protein [Pseudomonadales bacterium]